MLEYLSKAAWRFFALGDEAAEAWVGERALRILEGKASDVGAGLRRSATLSNLFRLAARPLLANELGDRLGRDLVAALVPM